MRKGNKFETSNSQSYKKSFENVCYVSYNSLQIIKVRTCSMFVGKVKVEVFGLICNGYFSMLFCTFQQGRWTVTLKWYSIISVYFQAPFFYHFIPSHFWRLDIQNLEDSRFKWLPFLHYNIRSLIQKMRRSIASPYVYFLFL